MLNLHKIIIFYVNNNVYFTIIHFPYLILFPMVSNCSIKYQLNTSKRQKEMNTSCGYKINTVLYLFIANIRQCIIVIKCDSMTIIDIPIVYL